MAMIPYNGELKSARIKSNQFQQRCTIDGFRTTIPGVQIYLASADQIGRRRTNDTTFDSSKEPNGRSIADVCIESREFL